MTSKIQAELTALREAFERGESILVIHYASGNFYLAKDHPVEVNCISIVDVSEMSTVSFGHSDYKLEDAEEREKGLLTDFYEYLGTHQDARIVHWNMNNADYGFEAIAARYRWLFGNRPPAAFPQARMLDLDSAIEELHGEAYAPHPKLFNLAALNKLSQRYWLKGVEEPDRAASGDYAAVQRSTSEKARAVAKLSRLLLDGELVTQESVGDVSFAEGRIDAVKTVLAVAQRMLLVERSLRRRHGDRPTITVGDEYDTQDLLRSLLVIFFEDVREETATPEYAAGSSRIDFILPDFKVAIEVKKSRDSMTSKTLADELIVDRDRYTQDDRVGHLICIVFDHEGRLSNPRGLESDLSRESSAAGLAVTVKIIDR
jgi:REase_DpnII-MboI